MFLLNIYSNIGVLKTYTEYSHIYILFLTSFGLATLFCILFLRNKLKKRTFVLIISMYSILYSLLTILGFEYFMEFFLEDSEVYIFIKNSMKIHFLMLFLTIGLIFIGLMYDQLLTIEERKVLFGGIFDYSKETIQRKGLIWTSNLLSIWSVILLMRVIYEYDMIIFYLLNS